MLHRLLYIAFCLAFLFCSLNAQSESLDRVALKILLGSPGYKAENYSLESAYRNLKTASNLPDPELGGEYLVMPADVDNRWTTELSWGLEWPGVYGARSKESSMKMTATEKAVASQRAERLSEIKGLLLDYLQCRQKMEIIEELSQNNDTIYRLALEAARGGELTILDLNKVKLEYANIRSARAALTDEEAGVVSEISGILGSDARSLLETLDGSFPELRLPTETEIRELKNRAPDVVAAQAEAKAAQQGRKVSRMEAFPNISVGYKHQFEDGMHFNGATLGISIPIFSSRGKQKAAEADIKEAEFKADAVGMEIEATAESLLQRLTRTKEQIEEVSGILESVDYNTTLLKAYQGGVMTLLEYISDRNYFTSAALELISLRHAAAKAQSQLDKYMGLPEL